MKTLLIFPTLSEASAALKFFGLTPDSNGFAKHDDLGLLISGMISPRAIKRVRETAREYSPETAILCGFCGACSPSLSLGELIFCGASPRDAAALESLGARRSVIKASKGIADAVEKRRLFEEDGIDAVDMESEEFLHVLSELGCGAGFTQVRCVSDTSESRMPTKYFASISDSETGDIKFSIIKTLKYFIFRPKELADLISFLRGAWKAKRRYDYFMLKYLKEISGESP